MHIAWINHSADFTGGAESYIAATSAVLRKDGVRQTLLYDSSRWMEPRFTALFDAAFPLVEPVLQLRQLRPDITYVHQLASEELLPQILASGGKTVRFFHDHKLFCPREHKYKTLSQETCRETVGWNCYPCLGVINRNDKWPKVRLRTVPEVRREIDANLRLDAAVVGSEYMRGHLVAHGFSPERVHVVHPFVERHALHTPPIRESKQVLFAGALLRGKGLDILLRAMKRLEPAVTLRIVGTGKQESEFRALADELRISSRIEWSGKLSRQDLAQAYATATVVAVPSRSPETFGLVGPEAMLYETPVVASDVGGMGEWLVDGETGYAFPSGDEIALADQLRRLIGSSETASRFGARAKNRTETLFRQDRHLAALNAIFARLVNS